MLNKICKIASGALLGLVAALVISYSTFAQAEVGMILDQINRAFIIAKTGYPLTLGSESTDGVNIVVANTRVAAFNSGGLAPVSGYGLRYPVAVPTMAATPAAGTNDFTRGAVNVVPTAASGAAAGMSGSPTAGDEYIIFNSGPNAIRVKAYGTPGINGAAAGTYIPLATMQYARCIASSATAYICQTGTVPTPAGP